VNQNIILMGPFVLLRGRMARGGARSYVYTRGYAGKSGSLLKAPVMKDEIRWSGGRKNEGMRELRVEKLRVTI